MMQSTHSRRRAFFSAVAAALGLVTTAAFADTLQMVAPLAGPVAVPNVVSLKQARFLTTLHQQYDFSCGFAAKGVEATLDQLAEAKVPAIALINENGYAHFVVIKGVRDGNVLIGDPAQGTRVISRGSFERYWTDNILLVAGSRVELARFNQYADWRIRPKAPLEDVRTYAADTALVTMMARHRILDF